MQSATCSKVQKVQKLIGNRRIAKNMTMLKTSFWKLKLEIIIPDIYEISTFKRFYQGRDFFSPPEKFLLFFPARCLCSQSPGVAVASKNVPFPCSLENVLRPKKRGMLDCMFLSRGNWEEMESQKKTFFLPCHNSWIICFYVLSMRGIFVMSRLMEIFLVISS